MNFLWLLPFIALVSEACTFNPVNPTDPITDLRTATPFSVILTVSSVTGCETAPTIGSDVLTAIVAGSTYTQANIVTPTYSAATSVVYKTHIFTDLIVTKLIPGQTITLSYLFNQIDPLRGGITFTSVFVATNALTATPTSSVIITSSSFVATTTSSPSQSSPSSASPTPSSVSPSTSSVSSPIPADVTSRSKSSVGSPIPADITSTTSTSTAAAAAAASSSSSASSGSSIPVAGIIGGVVGGVLGLALIIAFAVAWVRIKTHKAPREVEPGVVDKRPEKPDGPPQIGVESDRDHGSPTEPYGSPKDPYVGLTGSPIFSGNLNKHY